MDGYLSLAVVVVVKDDLMKLMQRSGLLDSVAEETQQLADLLCARGPKLTKIIEQIMLGGFWRLLGAVVGPFWSRGVTQDVSAMSGAGKVRNKSFFPCLFLEFWALQDTHFRYLSVSFDVFWGMFSGSGFRRPPGTIFEDVGVVSELCFHVLLKIVGGAWF